MRRLPESGRSEPSSGAQELAAPPVPADTPRRRRVIDRSATFVVSVGGWAIIASILAILFFIVVEVLPLATSVEVDASAPLRLAAAPDRAKVADVAELAVDEYLDQALVLHRDGRVMSYSLATGAPVLAEPPPTPAALVQTSARGASRVLAGVAAGGALYVWPYDWSVEFQGDRRIVRASVPAPVLLDLGLTAPPRCHAVARSASGALAAAAQKDSGELVLVREKLQENLFTGEVTREQERAEFACPLPLTRLVLDSDQRNLFGATAGGTIAWWRISDGVLEVPVVAQAAAQPVTAMELLLGEEALVVGQENGALTCWYRIREEDASRFRLVRARDLPPHAAAVTAIVPSQRDRSYLSRDRAGNLALAFATSGRLLWRSAAPVSDRAALCYGPKGDAALLATAAGLQPLRIRTAHPQATLATLFGKVWYEGLNYTGPEFVWQSTGGTESFEPKLSLIPLLFGTFKGTLYAMLIAVPLGVMGALFTAQFLHHVLRGFIKPAVELMASLPSVVLGFLAGLWLAPRMELVFPGFLAAAVLVPIGILLAGSLYRRLPRRVRGSLPSGSEVVWYALTLVATLACSIALSGRVENALFAGDFGTWLRATVGLTYDQRNAVVVGLAMGFAVIPIIFSISEEALSNVPRTLISGSLALGANRWQTMVRVVLPTASPGIFSAIMIGFGRAIGETMIVLMATGNTPVMDWNPFNGLRTLSANIAVEIPEAPHHGTLYRTLFLSALLLFVLTFILNTAAEMVRNRLRRRYASL